MCNAGLVCFPEIAERGTQDFSTRLIKHTELGEKARKASHYHLQWSTTVLKYAKGGPASNLTTFSIFIYVGNTGGPQLLK